MYYAAKEPVSRPVLHPFRESSAVCISTLAHVLAIHLTDDPRMPDVRLHDGPGHELSITRCVLQVPRFRVQMILGRRCDVTRADLPRTCHVWIAGPVIIGALCLFAVVGLLLVRRRLLPRLRVASADSEFTGAMLQSVMVFYGLAVALIAVTVFQTYSETTSVVTGEATALNALYRDVTGYPDPIRADLQRSIREYTDQVINQAWPLQQQGKVPSGGIEQMNRFQAMLTKFEPATEGQKLLHGETLRAYNQLIQARRLRLDAVGTGLPSVMWAVILIGAFISLSASFFFKVEDARLHLIEVLLLAIFIGLVIFMIFSLDRPFRGHLGIPADPYQLVYDQLMKSNP